MEMSNDKQETFNFVWAVCSLCAVKWLIKSRLKSPRGTGETKKIAETERTIFFSIATFPLFTGEEMIFRRFIIAFSRLSWAKFWVNIFLLQRRHDVKHKSEE